MLVWLEGQGVDCSHLVQEAGLSFRGLDVWGVEPYASVLHKAEDCASCSVDATRQMEGGFAAVSRRCDYQQGPVEVRHQRTDVTIGVRLASVLGALLQWQGTHILRQVSCRSALSERCWTITVCSHRLRLRDLVRRISKGGHAPNPFGQACPAGAWKHHTLRVVRYSFSSGAHRFEFPSLPE